MNKKEYLSEVTKKIFNTSAKEMVSGELEVHIDERTDYYKEIGYDDRASEEKAAEAMGEAETVAEQFAQLHNTFYNPVFDIIFLIAWGCALAGIYYLAENYAFGDEGMASVLLGASCLSFALMIGYSAISLYRNKLVPIIFSVIGIGGTGVFNYYIFIELEKQMNASFSNLIDFIIKTDIAGSGNYPNEEKVIAVIAAVSAMAVITVIFAFIYHIKVRRLANTLTDNRIMRFIFRFSMGVTIIAFLCGILLSVKCYFDVNKIQNEYRTAYSNVLEMIENCHSKEDIIKAVETADYEFTETTDKEGNLIGYHYNRNLVSIDISFEDVQSKESMMTEYLENIDETVNNYDAYLEENDIELDHYSGYSELYNQYINLLYENTDEYVESHYRDQAFCTIALNPNIGYFENSYDKITTSFLEINGEDETVFRLPENNNLGIEEQYEFCKKHVSARLNITFKLDQFERCSYRMEYIFGKQDFKNADVYYATRPDEKVTEIRDKAYETADIIKSDPGMSRAEIAEISGSTIEYPDISKEEISDTFKYLGSYFDELEEYMLEYYDSSVKYDCGDWFFCISGVPYEELYVYDDIGNYILSVKINEEPVRMNYTGENGLKRVSIDGLFYDKQGYVYKQAEYTPYYTSDGETYYYYCKTIKDDTHTVGDTKEYYLTDRNYNYYKADNCFIDEDGYLYINTSGNIKYDESDQKFTSTSGKVYTKAFETSWDENGNPILQSDEYGASFSF